LFIDHFAPVGRCLAIERNSGGVDLSIRQRYSSDVSDLERAGNRFQAWNDAHANNAHPRSALVDTLDDNIPAASIP
jgi:hypothetical protein